MLVPERPGLRTHSCLRCLFLATVSSSPLNLLAGVYPCLRCLQNGIHRQQAPKSTLGFVLVAGDETTSAVQPTSFGGSRDSELRSVQHGSINTAQCHWDVAKLNKPVF